MFLNLLHIYEKEIRKNTKNKRKVYLFEIYKMSYIKEIENIIDSTNEEYIWQRINFLEKQHGSELPRYEFGKGLPIGNMTSQFLSIFYLYKLDHKIIHDYHLKYYIRYMDGATV